jgi:hypothetical protein
MDTCTATQVTGQFMYDNKYRPTSNYTVNSISIIFVKNVSIWDISNDSLEGDLIFGRLLLANVSINAEKCSHTFMSYGL